MKDLTKAEMEKMLSSVSHGRLGLCKGNEPYVVPVAFGYNDGKIYIHGATTGKRIDYVKSNPKVCFEVDEYNSDGSWKSVIVYGLATLSDDLEIRLKGMKSVTRQRSGAEAAERITRNLVEKWNVYMCEIQVNQMTGRISGPGH